jgi:hypothetical protein
MSHHLDTPLASQNGQLYLDDLYVFQGNASIRAGAVWFRGRDGDD